MTSFEPWFRIEGGEWADECELQFSPFDQNHRAVIEYIARLKTVFDFVDPLPDIDAWAGLFEFGAPVDYATCVTGSYVSDGREKFHMVCGSKDHAKLLRTALSSLLEDDARVAKTLRFNPYES